jgi:hypothetical protein
MRRKPATSRFQKAVRRNPGRFLGDGRRCFFQQPGKTIGAIVTGLEKRRKAVVAEEVKA